MRQMFAIPLTLLVLLIGACNAASSAPSPLPSPVDSPLPTAVPLPSMTPTPMPTKTPTSTVAPTLTPVPTFTAVPNPTVTPEGVIPPAGLIYRRFDGISRIEADGQTRRLFDQSFDVAVSPDGEQLLVVQQIPARDALWLVNVNTGQQRNVIDGFDGTVCCPVWWPSKPDWALFWSWPRNAEAPDLGHLTAARLDGKEYRVLDVANRSSGLPAPSPDGRTIAYDAGGLAMLYDWETGPKVFNYEQYGLANIKRIASASWSPSGRQLAWYVGGDFGKDWQVGVAVFDLEAQTAQLIHIYTNVGRGGWFAAPNWSPDGRWLAFDAEDEKPEGRGIWVVSMTGGQRIEHNVGLGTFQWSPDGTMMIVGHSVIEVGTWHSQQIALPLGAEVIGWVALSE